MTLYSDLALSRRLERTEGTACARFAEARRRVYPDKNSEWIESAGAIAVFDGADSPTTQSFGLGLFEELTPAKLDAVERFFLERGAPVNHEVSPLAGLATLDLLCSRNYRPVELSSVLYRLVDRPQPAPNPAQRLAKSDPAKPPCGAKSAPRLGRTNTPTCWNSSARPPPSPPSGNTARASSPNSTANPARPVRCVCMKASPCLAVRPLYPRCAAVVCNLR